MKETLLGTLLLALLLTQTGCGILFGNIRPVEEKSQNYGVTDLARESPDWVKLSKRAVDPNADQSSSGISDVAYQSKKNASVISLNSACRPANQTKEESLEELTNLLLLGIDIKRREEQPLQIQKLPALQTTIDGIVNKSEVMIRSVVLRKGQCVYDLMYIARPATFPEYAETFSHFVASLRLKE